MLYNDKRGYEKLSKQAQPEDLVISYRWEIKEGTCVAGLNPEKRVMSDDFYDIFLDNKFVRSIRAADFESGMAKAGIAPIS